MRIGVDFDNTIVCYDALFHRVAAERGLIPTDLPVNKSAVRDHLRQIGREQDWTEMQGYVYGVRMSEAAPYPGVIDFFHACRRAGIEISIISHKTRHPFLGERHDLHGAARHWLEQQGFFDPSKIGLSGDAVFFELTKQAKLERIAQRGCGHFIDDLPELLAEPAFPRIDRILFDPNDLYAGETAFFRARSWAEIAKRFRGELEGSGIEAAIESLATAGGLTPPVAAKQIAGGGNNRVYLATSAGGQAIVKNYFRHAADTRDRFKSERAFYEFLWRRGIRRTPEPLAWDAENRLGLFSCVEGRKLLPGEVDAGAVDQALEFVLELNRDRSGAGAVPTASEACFSLAEHLAVIDRRVDRLGQIEAGQEIDRKAVAFARGSLRPAWDRILDSIRAGAVELDRPLREEERALSPSDFGFHNALVGADGRLRFLDFEYAGWDDPAKLICDFFCQPQVPVPLEFWGRVTSALAGAFAGAEERARRLLPAYQIKWCCILLNEFLGRERERRDFAQGAVPAEERKTAQLAKATAALDRALQIWKAGG